MTGQVIINVTLVRVILNDCDPYAAPVREPVKELSFAGKDRKSAERAWYRSDEYRNHGVLDWDIR